MARLVEQIKEALAAFVSLKTPPALIGGFALATHNVVRATQDIDFLADAADADSLDTILRDLGYRCLHRSEDADNYVRGDEGMDFLFAHRPKASSLLHSAEEKEAGLGRLRVGSAERLIKRTSTVDCAPQTLFMRESGVPYRPSPDRDPFEAWIALMEVVEALCPTLLKREHRTTGRFQL